jgi:hypothetical protein
MGKKSYEEKITGMEVGAIPERGNPQRSWESGRSGVALFSLSAILARARAHFRSAVKA